LQLAESFGSEITSAPQSFIVQGAIAQASQALTSTFVPQKVSKTLHQFFKLSKKPPPEQIVSQSYQEQTAQKICALSELHAQTQVALASVGLSQSYAPDPIPRKAGRPQGSKDVQQRCRRKFSKKAEPTAAVKLQLASELQERRKETGQSLMRVLKDMARQYGCSTSMLRKLRKESRQKRLQQFVAERGLGLHGLRKRGSHLANSKHTSKSEGKRLPGERGYLGKTDHHRELWLATKRWSQLEEANGHQLSQSDLLRDFKSRLSSAIKVADAIPDRTISQQIQLDAWKKKLNTLEHNPKQRDKFAAILMNRCELVSRSCQRATNLSAEEERQRVIFGWRFFDQALADIVSQETERTAVRDPADFIAHASETAITMSDQIPVWLKVEPGKLLTSKIRLKLAAEQRKIRRENRKKKTEPADNANPRVTTVRKSAGKPPRWRVSFIARQAVERFFDYKTQPVGRILPSILLVPGTHGRLENISRDGLYIKDECFQLGDQLVERKAGEKAGQHMLSWRKAREERPEFV
jgi:hypothetical protein